MHIRVININDEIPKFETIEKNRATILEESVPPQCIFNVRAYDPDIGNRHESQNISYFINKGQEHFSINEVGCVKVIKPLNRDPDPDPNRDGSSFWQIIVGAYDEWGLTPTKKAAYKDLFVDLEDINDNAPKYNGTNPVVWYENQPK